MPRRALTFTESRVLIVVRAFAELDPPRAPVLREIAEAMGWKSTSAAHQYVQQLEAAGYVRRERGRAGVHVVPESARFDDPASPPPDPEA